jgi:outer membrane protein TolC
LPADLLARRPDLHAAEFRLRKALAHVDQTKLRFYPSFTLTGALGTSSNTLTSILHNPIGSLALNMALPFVEWHTFRTDTQIAQLDYQQAVIEFRETLYKALKDVDDALLARTQYRESARLHQREFEYATQSEKIAEVRYRAGQTSIKEWLDQQEAKRQAEFVLVENYYHQLTNLTKLYQALGE